MDSQRLRNIRPIRPFPIGPKVDMEAVELPQATNSIEGSVTRIKRAA